MYLKVSCISCVKTELLFVYILLFMVRRKGLLLGSDSLVCLLALQFLSTLFAPLNFVMEKVESILPSSLWHQLTRIWMKANSPQWLSWHFLCQLLVDHQKAWLFFKREAVSQLKTLHCLIFCCCTNTLMFGSITPCFQKT